MIRAIKLPDDLVEINNWMRERSGNNIDLDLLPPQGFIEPKVAAGFLITTNTSIAFLEHFVSNPKANKETRAKALDDIAGKLIQAAEGSGIRMIMAMTKHPSIVRLCGKYKFHSVDTLVFGRIK